MKRISIMMVFLGLMGCKESPKAIKTETEPPLSEVAIPQREYPQEFQKVLTAHGGLQNWKNYRTLTFEISKPDSPEKHTIDLYSRKDKVEMPNFSMGFDGKQVWLHDVGQEYKGNAEVYHNLMFYFYAMPFVLADKGIAYENTEDLVFEGKNYPGIHIHFADGIGASSKDDYYIHYDPVSHQMVWLGYTFTYGSNEKSDKVNWIRYDDWTNVEGVLLPKSITWYSSEEGKLKAPANQVLFENISLSTSPQSAAFYARPELSQEK